MSEMNRRCNCGSHRFGGRARGPVDSGSGPILGQRAEARAKEREEKVLNEELMESVLNPSNLKAAYEHVRANGGAAGVDGMGVEVYAEHAGRHWPVIEAKLMQGDYRPGAIRGVNISKPQGGERRLGIPTVVS